MISRRWLFLNTGFRDGEFNMNFDRGLAHLFGKGKIRPVLRVYGWKPYAISIGYNQDESVFDIEKIKKAGFDFVRRPTGGRAILHSEELTYSIVVDGAGKTVLEVYNLLSRGIAKGLSLLGAKFELEESQPNFSKIYKQFSSIPCFATSAKYEIHFAGRKVVGSAQRRYGDVVLQHGSILIGEFHKKLPEFLKVESQDLIEKMKLEIERKTICLNEILGRNVSFEEVADSLKRGFEVEFGISFEEISETKLLEMIL